jgi:hypothetical protein
MGLGIGISKDSRDCGNNSAPYQPPNPNPHNFEVKFLHKVNGYSIMYVNYPDCTNYEGNKILVYDKGFDVNILLAVKRVDPHFFSHKDSPIARFEPTERGLKMACSFAENYREE